MRGKLRKGSVIIWTGREYQTLTQMEYDLFQTMRNHPDVIWTRERLLRDVWGFQSSADTRTVDMCVLRLRRKIGADRIQSVYGKGYVLIT